MDMEMRRKQPIGVELVKRGIVQEADIENALQYQREHPSKKIGDILYILGVCDPKTLIDAIADILGEKGVILNQSTIKIKLTDYISLDIAKQNKAVPFEVNSGKIKICFANSAKNKDVRNEKVRVEFGACNVPVRAQLSPRRVNVLRACKNHARRQSRHLPRGGRNAQARLCSGNRPRAQCSRNAYARGR